MEKIESESELSNILSYLCIHIVETELLKDQMLQGNMNNVIQLSLGVRTVNTPLLNQVKDLEELL